MTSKIKVDNINKVSDDSNIIKKCGTTITLGASGDSIALASGASQTGFGRTGTVDWQTGSIKTSTFTAANGEGYFCNTAGGAFELDLPAGSAGAIVSIQDYNNTFDSNGLTVDPNGSEKINGGIAGDPVVLDTEGQGVTFVYIDSTVGWRSVQSNEYATPGAADTFICASVSGTGNTLTTAPCCSNMKVATFTGPGNFTINSGSGALSKVDYLILGGGAGGGGSQPSFWAAGGGGAGGFRESKSAPISGCWSASPLASTTPLGPFVPGTYAVAVGGGGPSGTGNPNYASRTSGGNGSVSTFSTITSAGGGGGAFGGSTPGGTGINGGSGSGGGGEYPGSTGPAGSGNTPPVSPPQGNNGGTGGQAPAARGSGGGGGASAAGENASGSGGDGGTGSYMVQTGFAGCHGTPGPVGSTRYFAGGGGGGFEAAGGHNGEPGTGGGGGGGPNSSAPGNGRAATANTGGGGGGGSRGQPGTNSCQSGAAGGKGIVIIRYKFQ